MRKTTARLPIHHVRETLTVKQDIMKRMQPIA